MLGLHAGYIQKRYAVFDPRCAHHTNITTTDQIILFSLFGAVFSILLWGRFCYDLVAF